MAVFSLVIFSYACQSGYQRVLKGNDYALKEAKAREFFEKKKYARALPLFDEVLNVNIGKPAAEDLTYHVAYCYYGMHDYLLANYYFTLYGATFYSKPDRKEECEYMAAYCHYMDSPRESLDQTNTEDAIVELQIFVNKHPNSERIKSCTELIELLLVKLENKMYKKAILYYDLEYYNSCVVTFQNLLREFPDTKRRAEAGFMMVKSSYLYGANSIKKVKKDRLLETVKLYNQHVDKFKETNYAKEAESYLVKAQATIKLLEADELKLEQEIEAQKEKERIRLEKRKNKKKSKENKEEAPK